MIKITCFTMGEVIDGFRKGLQVGLARLILNVLYGLSFIFCALLGSLNNNRKTII
ncbi:MAG: hypothetical protein JXM72_10490 [Deltaproteobacteria bacterium]|nr:hypothetical protein [Deltaproteobacteria bacterium]